MSALGTNWPKHPLFENLSKEHIGLLARTASEERFEPCELIFHEGNEADKFYLIVEGKVAIEILANGRGRVTVRTIDAGEVLGWSWLVEPYRWHFDAQATVATKAIVFDANVVRESFSKHPEFGFAMMKGFLPIIVQRLQAVSDDLRFATALILS